VKEADKGFKNSKKLQAAIFAAVVILAILIDNRHNPLLMDHALSICEAVIVAALGGRIGMQITQAIVTNAEDIVQKFDPKDIDGLPE